MTNLFWYQPKEAVVMTADLRERITRVRNAVAVLSKVSLASREPSQTLPNPAAIYVDIPEEHHGGVRGLLFVSCCSG